MSTVATAIRRMASRVSCAIDCEPAITPDYNQSDLQTIAAAMFVLIYRGIDTADRLIGYFAKRGCAYDCETLTFLLNQFDGGDQRHCLWRRDRAGHYALLGNGGRWAS